MKRRLISASATAVLILGLCPGSALAVPGNVDQSADPSAGWYLFDWPVTQSFTAGVTGMITHIQLHCGADNDASPPVTFTLTYSPLPAVSAQCGGPLGWVDFVLPQSRQVIAGSQYTFEIYSGGTPARLSVADSDYPGGQAGDPGGGGPLALDFAFRTYVYSVVFNTAWSQAQVPGGSSTMVSLIGSFSFAGMPTGDFTSGPTYSLALTDLPGWFTPTGVACSGQITGGDCNVPSLMAGVNPSGDGSPMTVTVNISGNAAPAIGDPEDPGVGSWTAGVAGVGTGFSFGIGDSVDDQLGVGAGSQVTPPPTGTGESDAPGGAPLWLLPGAMAALLGSLLVIRRQARAIR